MKVLRVVEAGNVYENLLVIIWNCMFILYFSLGCASTRTARLHGLVASTVQTNNEAHTGTNRRTQKWGTHKPFSILPSLPPSVSWLHMTLICLHLLEQHCMTECSRNMMKLWNGSAGVPICPGNKAFEMFWRVSVFHLSHCIPNRLTPLKPQDWLWFYQQMKCAF